jgi:hypothetical protein
MTTVLLGVAFIIGLALLISVACERELLRAEREERPQKATCFMQLDGRGHGTRQLHRLTTRLKQNGPDAMCGPTRSKIKTPRPLPSESDEAAA